MEVVEVVVGEGLSPGDNEFTEGEEDVGDVEVEADSDIDGLQMGWL